MAGDGRFQYKQDNREKDEGSAGPIHGKHIEREKGEDETDRTDHAGQYKPGMRDLDVHTQQACERENQRHIWIQDTREDLLPAGHFEGLNAGAPQLERYRPVIKAANLLAVVAIDDALNIRNHRVDQILLQRLFRRE